MLKNRKFRILLSLISGVVLSLAWLGFPGWILFIAFLPLLLLDDFFVDEKKDFKSISFWGHTYLVFIVWNALTTWWVMHATLSGAIIVVFLNSFLMSLIWWLAHIARRRFTNSMGYLSLIVFWISFEFFHYHWQIEWPWLTLGNGFANNVKIIQWYEFTGMFGGTLWVLIVNILLFQTLKKLQQVDKFKRIIKPLAIIILFILIPVIYSVTRYNSYVEKEDSRNIVVVQPNIDPYSESYDLMATNEKLSKFLRLIEPHLKQNTDFIVGPETFFEQGWDEEYLERYPQFYRLSMLTDFNLKLNLVIGATTRKFYKEGQKLSSTARTTSEGIKYDVYNAAIIVNNNRKYQIYHKSILVTGVEKMPFRSIMKYMDKLIINLGGTTGGYGIQEEPTNFVAYDSTLIAPAICYESVFGEHMTKFVKKGAQAIFIITNDGWWKNTPGYKQHLSFARLRAIETRRSIARSANTGISCFINQRGDVSQKTSWWKEAVIKGKINLNNKITFYVRYGDYIARISMFMSGLILLYLISVSLKQKKV